MLAVITLEQLDMEQKLLDTVGPKLGNLYQLLLESLNL